MVKSQASGKTNWIQGHILGMCWQYQFDTGENLVRGFRFTVGAGKN